jgi:hypothetical protein
VIFVRRPREERSRTVISSDAGFDEDDRLDRGPTPLVRVVAAILVVALFILMTDLFVSLVLGR